MLAPHCLFSFLPMETMLMLWQARCEQCRGHSIYCAGRLDD
jgi:hypothetical protein